MARTKPRNRAWQRAGTRARTRGLSGRGPALGPARAPTPAARAERCPDPPRSLAASHPATTDTGRQPGAGTPPCSSLRAMTRLGSRHPRMAGVALAVSGQDRRSCRQGAAQTEERVIPVVRVLGPAPDRAVLPCGLRRRPQRDQREDDHAQHIEGHGERGAGGAGQRDRLQRRSAGIAGLTC